MKRCPECRRDYYHDTLLYCLNDRNELHNGPASGSDSKLVNERFGSLRSIDAVPGGR